MCKRVYRCRRSQVELFESIDDIVFGAHDRSERFGERVSAERGVGIGNVLAVHAGIDKHTLSRIGLDQIADDRNVDPHAA
ncbi:MAG: hypothetical protein R2845_09775 [Thermomicrobiales bacterium]